MLIWNHRLAVRGTQARILEKWIKFWVEWTLFKTCVTCYATCPILAGATPVGAAMLFFARLVAPRPPAGPGGGPAAAAKRIHKSV